MEERNVRDATTTCCTVKVVPVPESMGQRSALGRVDYLDCFCVPVGGVTRRSASQWAREALLGAGPATRRRLRLGWRTLGLELGPASTGVLGWSIREASEEHILLSAESRFGMPAELMFERQTEGLLFSNLVRFDNRVMEQIWLRFAPTHRRVAGEVMSALSERSRRNEE